MFPIRKTPTTHVMKQRFNLPLSFYYLVLFLVGTVSSVMAFSSVVCFSSSSRFGGITTTRQQQYYYLPKKYRSNSILTSTTSWNQQQMMIGWTWMKRDFMALYSTPEEQTRFIEYQVQESQSSSSSSSSSSSISDTDVDGNTDQQQDLPQQQRQQQEDDEQLHLQHQQRVFDSMSQWFAPDRQNEVTPELVPVYQAMAKNMMTQLLNREHYDQQQKNRVQKSPTNAGTGIEESNTGTMSTKNKTRKTLRILDIACGTGVLWDFLLEAAASAADKEEDDDQSTTISLDIVGVDLSPSMIEYATQRVQKLLLSPDNNNDTHKEDDDDNIDQEVSSMPSSAKHSINLFVGDIVQYLQQQQQQEPFDGIILNACFGNFYNPGQVLANIPYSSSDSPPTTIFISHPLGATFVQQLHDQDPKTVPHTLPLSTIEMVEKWTFGLPGLVPMTLHHKGTMMDDTTTSSDYYMMTLKRLERATPLSTLQRYRGIVDSGYGRGGKKLGVPTANLPSRLFQDALSNIEPGVYFGWAYLEHLQDRLPFQAVVNVGYSPTFEGEENKEKIIEAHLIDGKGLDDFYGQEMRLELSGYLRPEKKFDSFPALLGQIRADITEAQLALEGSPYIELRNKSSLFVVETYTERPWIGRSGGDTNASWEFIDHREVLSTLLK